MPRNPEHQFFSSDANEILSALIAAYETMTGAGVAPASPERLFIGWVAQIIIQERVIGNIIGNQNIPSRAEGENLDALGQLFRGRERPGAQPAVCTMRFHISAAQPTSILIPGGTRVTGTGGALVWETIDDAYIPIGELSADVPARCQTPGVTGNGYETGQINTLVDISGIPYYSRCGNITASGGGADIATDDEYYELLRQSQDTYGTAGAKGSYIYFAKQVSTEIADVAANSLQPGYVNLYVLMKDGTVAGEEIKNAVYRACSPDDVRPLTDYVVVGDPETVGYDIDFTYYIPGGAAVSSAEVEQAVQTAVQEYIGWQCGKLGRDINPDELRRRLLAAGVKRIELNSPAFTPLRDGRDNTVPQVAAVGTVVNIVNGGYEDE